MAWTTPITWALNAIPHSSDFNQQVRDNINALHNMVAPSLKTYIQRQGVSSGVWENGGTNNYTSTGAFIQAGITSVTLTTSGTNWTQTVTLPVPLSGGVANGLSFITPVDDSFGWAAYYCAINWSSELAISVRGQFAPSSQRAIAVNWMVIGE